MTPGFLPSQEQKALADCAGLAPAATARLLLTEPQALEGPLLGAWLTLGASHALLGQPRLPHGRLSGMPREQAEPSTT